MKMIDLLQTSMDIFNVLLLKSLGKKVVYVWSGMYSVGLFKAGLWWTL